jgi:uncharacterized lipoprotein
MLKKLAYGLPILLLGGCADTSDRYRDTQHLELPPELPIEHTHSQTAIAENDLKPKTSALSGLMSFEDHETKPKLALKTRPDRAWEIVSTALKLSELEVLDKNRELNRFQVKYDADNTEGEEGNVLDIFLNNDYEDSEYVITLKEEILGVMVHAELSKQDEFAEDGSAVLIRLLHKIIDEKIINRDASRPDKE